MQFKPCNVLVTGAAGFIGSNFVMMMLERYSNIRLISYDKLTYAGSLENLKNIINHPNHIFIENDICNQAEIKHLLQQYNIDCIVHFAAESHVDRSIAGPMPFIQTNVVGTFSLLEAAKKVWLEYKGWGQSECRFHHISTDEVYGSLGVNDPAFIETSPMQPNSPYSASKASSDHLVRAYCETYGLPTTLTNCSNNYGLHQHNEKLLPTVIHACLNQTPIPVYGDGLNIRDWLYVEDHCNAVDLVLRSGKVGEVYNIGGEAEICNIDLVIKVCQLMQQWQETDFDYQSLITFVTDRKGHDRRYAINNGKIKSQLGWSPKWNLNDGLLKTIKFYSTRYANSEAVNAK